MKLDIYSKLNRYKMLHYKFIELVKWIKQKLRFLLVMKTDQEIHLIVCYLESLIFEYRNLYTFEIDQSYYS